STAVSRASRDTLNENPSSLTANPACHSNLPAQRLRLDHYDGRRAIRQRAFRRNTHQQPAGETAAQLLHPFLLTRRLPRHESFSHFECCRDLAAFVMRLDPLTARGSTSQTDEGPSPASAVDYAKLIRQPDGAPPHEAPPSCRCLPRKERLADCLRAVLAHLLPYAPTVRLSRGALDVIYTSVRWTY